MFNLKKIKFNKIIIKRLIILMIKHSRIIYLQRVHLSIKALKKPQ